VKRQRQVRWLGRTGVLVDMDLAMGLAAWVTISLDLFPSPLPQSIG